MPAGNFSHLLLHWFHEYGRHDLPWQHNVTPYRVWVSEIMLQQTQVTTVIPYFNAFIEHFPDCGTLAAAQMDEVLHYWTGLGYYARARNLHRAARIIMEDHNGIFPSNIDYLMLLPGIGRSTAGAILSLAYGQCHTILDGNVKRVLTRYHAVSGWPGLPGVERELWQLAEQHTPHKNVAHYTQAIMDLGATVCTRRNPRCGVCPVNTDCYAYQQSRQHEFPQAKPRKSIPVRKTVFAILENHQGEILLEHRPPAGIWGGLWAFPEFSSEGDIQSWVEGKLGYSINTLECKSLIRHTFSHFHLDIMPVHARVNTRNNRINDADRYCWYEPSGKQYLGMATPVKKLLQELTFGTNE
jgi:A/G-specific adenine glycosylase